MPMAIERKDVEIGENNTMILEPIQQRLTKDVIKKDIILYIFQNFIGLSS